MKGIKISPKKFSKDYLKQHGDIIFKNRELVIEEDKGTDSSSTTQRFKIGDGFTPYSALKYASSVYAFYPEIIFYDDTYNNYVAVQFGGD